MNLDPKIIVFGLGVIFGILGWSLSRNAREQDRRGEDHEARIRELEKRCSRHHPDDP